MYTYHTPLVGLVLSIEEPRTESFFKCLNSIIDDWDLQSINDFNSSVILEFLGENKNVDKEISDLVTSFFKWIEENADELEYKETYHGSAIMPPRALFFKAAKKIPYNDYCSYVMSHKTLESILEDVSDFNDFCEETMDKKLFNFLKDNKLLGLQFFNVSS